MVISDTDSDNWWKDHPLFSKFYCPLIITATFVVTLVDIITSSSGAHCT